MYQEDDCLCPRYCRAIDVLAKRWTCLIVSILLQGPRRFSELEHSIPGIGGRMLTERLKDLESHGIVERQVGPPATARVEYALTSKGDALRRVIHEIELWADQWDSTATEAAVTA
jgi:DNA-binding HxlR family transcriptional regulator